MNLRDYQLKCVEAIYKEWETHRSTCAVLATGLGKTIIFANVIGRMFPKRTMVIAHRKELIEQAVDKIQRAVDIPCDVEMGWQKSSEDLIDKRRVIVATVQTLNSRDRMKKWNPMEFGLIVIDETHHAAADTYKNVLDYFSVNPDIKILGVTATPDRADEKALGQIFETWAFHYDIIDGINDGWLVPITQQFCEVLSLDFSHVRTTAGDLNQGDLERIMEAEENVQGVCQPILEVSFGLEPKTLTKIDVPKWNEYLGSLGKNPRRGIVFTVSVLQAEACCNVLNRAVPGIAEWLCGKTPHDAREDILKRYQNGKTAIVVNCGVLTEGFDAPMTETIFMARPTKSRSLYTQMCGRATRTVPGLVDPLPNAEVRKGAIANSSKPRCRIIDFAGNSGRHKLICALDILGGKWSDEVKERAIKEAKESGKPVTVTKQLNNAESALKREQLEMAERLRLEEEARKKKIVAKSDYTQADVDPFGQQSFGYNGRGKQKKPATFKQCRVLERAGIPTRNLDSKRARFFISVLAENNWKLPEKFEWIRHWNENDRRTVGVR